MGSISTHSFPRSGNLAKHGVEFRHSIRNASRSQQKVGSLCLHAKQTISQNRVGIPREVGKMTKGTHLIHNLGTKITTTTTISIPTFATQ